MLVLQQSIHVRAVQTQKTCMCHLTNFYDQQNQAQHSQERCTIMASSKALKELFTWL
jgi:hypothetical protein